MRPMPGRLPGGRDHFCNLLTAWRHHRVALAAGLTACGFGVIPRLLLSDQGGSVVLVAAIGITLLMYGGAIAIDLANLYYNKSIIQRVADQSAIAAAFAYASSGSTATAQNAASSLALANGVPSANNVAVTIGPSPTGDGSLAAEVAVTSPVSVSGFGRVMIATTNNQGGSNNLVVGATAFAEIHQATPCILALQAGGAGIAMTGGTKLTASNCSVASNAGVTLSNGPSLTASNTYAVGSINASAATINGPQYPNSSKQSDPYAASNAFARLSTVGSMTSPNAPSLPSVAHGANQSCSGSLALAGGTSYGTVSDNYYNACTISFSGGGTTSMQGISLTGSAVTLSFGAGTYNIGSFSVSSYGTVQISIASGTVINITGALAISACTTFTGSATWVIGGGLSDSSSCGTVSFINTNAASLSTFTIAGGIAIYAGHAVFPNGTYTISSAGSACAGLCVSGGASAVFGNGSFIVSDGISVGGGGTLTLGSAQDSNSVFQIPSTLPSANAISTGGGSLLSIGSFPYVDLNGPIQLQGSATLGAGTWTVNGALDMASSGGGTLYAPSNMLVASGPIAFGAGYNAVTLQAPTAISSATEGAASTVALASNSTTASAVGGGANSTVVTGLVYLPNAALTESGGGNLTGNGNCMQVIASSINLSGGGMMSTNCSSLGTGAAGHVVSLVE